MPYQSSTFGHFSSEDYGKVALATLIPGSAAAVAFAVFVQDKSTIDWWKRVRKPKWAPQDLKVYSAIDLLALSPIGCASYLVYKHGGGFDYADTRLALGLYGVNLALALGSIPVTLQKNLKLLFGNTLALHLTAAATSVAFYKIHKHAGLMMVPYALWSGFYVALTYAIMTENTIDID
uniref:TspO/MBR-related protein n=1 Tax=Plectus sambesii TaxID=2011161 RepID=A0A914X1L9_9BILA